MRRQSAAPVRACRLIRAALIRKLLARAYRDKRHITNYKG